MPKEKNNYSFKSTHKQNDTKKMLMTPLIADAASDLHSDDDL